MTDTIAPLVFSTKLAFFFPIDPGFDFETATFNGSRLQSKVIWIISIFSLFVFVCVCVSVCLPELDWPREAAGAGWVDWQLWAHTSEAYDAGDRAAVSARLHLPAAQRSEFPSSASPPLPRLPVYSDLNSHKKLLYLFSNEHTSKRHKAVVSALIVRRSSLASF